MDGTPTFHSLINLKIRHHPHVGAVCKTSEHDAHLRADVGVPPFPTSVFSLEQNKKEYSVYLDEVANKTVGQHFSRCVGPKCLAKVLV